MEKLSGSGERLEARTVLPKKLQKEVSFGIVGNSYLLAEMVSWNFLAALTGVP